MRFKAGRGPSVYMDNAMIYGGGIMILISLSPNAETIFSWLGPALIGAAVVHIFYRAFMNLFKVGL